MNDKDKVRSYYPFATVEFEYPNIWVVWHISRDKQRQLSEEHWPEVFPFALLGLGRTEEEAWARAVSSTEAMICRKLPIKSCGPTRA